MSSVCSLCVFLVCFHSLCKWLAWHFSGGPCCTVFSFRWFVRSNGLFSANLFIRAFIPSVPGICFQLATFTSSKKERNAPHHSPQPAHGWLQGCASAKRKSAASIEPYLSLKEGRCFPLATGSIQGRNPFRALLQGQDERPRLASAWPLPSPPFSVLETHVLPHQPITLLSRLAIMDAAPWNKYVCVTLPCHHST